MMDAWMDDDEKEGIREGREKGRRKIGQIDWV